MLKEISNKAMKKEKTKHVEDVVLDKVTVVLKNRTIIDGILYNPGAHELTHRQYEQVKRFL